MKRSVISVCVLVVLCTAVLAQNPAASPTDPRIGTWKVNLQKSTYSPGPRPNNAAMRRHGARPDGFLVFTQSNVDAQGNPTFIQVVHKLDGKEYPQYDQTSLANFLATGARSTVANSYRLDGQTVILTPKNNGVPGIPIVFTVSRDGKTMTQTTKGTNAQGQQINNVVVWERMQ